MTISKPKAILFACVLLAAVVVVTVVAQTTSSPSDKAASSPATGTSASSAVAIKPSGPARQDPTTVKVTPTNVGAVYVGILLRSKDLAKLATSQANMASLGKTMMLYVQENDKFPASLDELKMSIASPGDSSLKFTYVPGRKPSSPANQIVAYDPVSYGGKIVVLKVDCSVETIASEEEMNKRMESKK